MSRKKVKVGDTIKFTTGTFHSGQVTATRKVKIIDQLGIGVMLFGYNPYYLTPGSKGDKILKINDEPTTKRR